MGRKTNISSISISVDNQELNKLFVLVCEGSCTEKQYFEKLAPLIGNVDVKCTEKYGLYKDMTVLDDLIDLTCRRIKFYKDKICNPIYFISGLTDQFCPVRQIAFDKEYQEQFDEAYELEFEDYIEKVKPIIQKIKKYIKDNYGDNIEVTENNVDDVLNESEKLIVETFTNYTRPGREVFDEISPLSSDIGNPNCEFAIIHDRDWSQPAPYEDYQSFNDKDYMDALDRVKREGIDLYISSPNFEFWLLMHHDEFEQFDTKTLDRLLSSYYPTGAKKGIPYKKETWRKGKEMVLRELNISEKRNPKSKIKAISPDRFRYYGSHYIEASDRKVVTDNAILIDRCGSNVGLLIKRMINS